MSNQVLQQLNAVLAELERISADGGSAGKRADGLLAQLYPLKKGLLLEVIGTQTAHYAVLAEALQQGAEQAQQARQQLLKPAAVIVGIENCMAKALKLLASR
ncbi:hypothetical protein [Nissabacter sp. SGAir0207]|uniref:hypothetical protein n=1 Tax=Nissabacter sp. SGAir0207 TaxID=2126321 RepID=UPI0010CD62C6|nr:hypothetical protein [Nissabacter sp. SGAir0207]QCR36255.1 hypothetical protein C1N62_09185 [Nissabacter sp. SGAir0207]